jgi:hypothetical protein
VRTVPEKTYQFAPRGEFTILDTYRRALRSAQRLVYLENQFLWSPEITDVLIEKLQRPPHEKFRIVLVLPRSPSNGADTTRGQLGRLIAADTDSDRRHLLAATLTAHDQARSAPLYVHAKIGIVDDRWLTVGSANLNGARATRPSSSPERASPSTSREPTRRHQPERRIRGDRRCVAAAAKRTTVIVTPLAGTRSCYALLR